MLGKLRRALGILRRKQKIRHAISSKGWINAPALEASILKHLNNRQLEAFARHDAHRIEKSFYNEIFFEKYAYFLKKRDNVKLALHELRSRGAADTKSSKWAGEIASDFQDLREKFILPNSTHPIICSVADTVSNLDSVGRDLSRRRSCRVWSENQPTEKELELIGTKLIEAAVWSPNSGNRQPWRFRLITSPEEKLLIKDIKEEHCYRAPAIIFVGMDKTVYGALGEREDGLAIDAGACIMSMVVAAHMSGIGSCWNHFARDLIQSRQQNVEAYENFRAYMGYSKSIEPIALLAYGLPKIVTPPPARNEVSDYLL